MCLAIYLTTQYSLAPPRAGFLLNQYDECRIGTYPMSKEQLKAFLEKVEGDTSLQEKLKGASDANAVTAIAKEAGFSISADDLTKGQSELSDEELIAVNGGFFWGPGGGVAGGIMQGAAANRVGVQLDAGSGGVGAPASVGRMLAGQ